MSASKYKPALDEPGRHQESLREVLLVEKALPGMLLKKKQKKNLTSRNLSAAAKSSDSSIFISAIVSYSYPVSSLPESHVLLQRAA